MAQKYIKIPPFGTFKYDNGAYPKGYDTDAPIAIGSPVDETDAAQFQDVIDIERLVLLFKSGGENDYNLKRSITTLQVTVEDNIEESKRYSLLTRGR